MPISEDITLPPIRGKRHLTIDDKLIALPGHVVRHLLRHQTLLAVTQRPTGMTDPS